MGKQEDIIGKILKIFVISLEKFQKTGKTG